MKIFNLFNISIIFIFLLSACRTVDELTPGSVFDNQIEEGTVQTDLDKYIYDKLTKVYNIDLIYRWDASLVDGTRYLYPTDPAKIRIIVDMLLDLWIIPYSQLGGESFVKRIAPRQIVLVGSQNLNPGEGTVLLGLADQGRRITLFNINSINFSNKSELIKFFNTIHHEYTHILNQTVPFDIINYSKITPNYILQWNLSPLSEAKSLGFITTYSRKNESEDVAEIVSHLVVESRSDWDALEATLPDDGRAKFQAKKTMVFNYFIENFNIDLYELQTLVNNATRFYTE